MSDWDDLFAAAAGEVGTGSSISLATENSSATPPSSIHKKKRQKGKGESSTNCSKKRRSNNVDAGNQSSLFRAFLKSRVNHVDEQAADFPHWFNLGQSLCTKSSSPLFCSGYTKSYTSSSEATDECERCSLSPLYHSSQINLTKTRGGDQSFLQSFTLIRDIRCCCSCIYEIMAQSAPSEKKRRQDKIGSCSERMYQAYEFTSTAKYKANKLLNSMTTSNLVPNGEKEILEAKFQAVYDCARTLYSIMKRFLSKKSSQQYQNNTMGKKEAKGNKPATDFSLGGIFDDLLSLIMKCDAAYYRLYYLQVSGYLPILEDYKGGEMIHISHPPNYFGKNNFTWNVKKGKEWRDDILNKIRQNLNIDNDTFNKLCVEKLGDVMTPLGLTRDTTELSKRQDPLSFMHRNRFMEGLLIFWRSGWIASNEAYLQTVNVLTVHDKNHYSSDSHEKFYQEHETIAPQILADWRDSCRDLLCNLYGYATVPLSTLARIIQDLDSVNNVIEMGAGTGYLAYLLNEEGVRMSAFDIAPTVPLKNCNTMRNEYHGLTQPFFEVKKGNAKQLKTVLKNKKLADASALLLSYPPPLSSMAEDALFAYKSLGGRCVIHVGEFSGLTGSRKFQQMLRHDFKLISRYDCLQWGTDCAEATIWWENDHKGGDNPSNLIPCSCCKKKEALKRCRLSRSLRYCSLECFHAHSTERLIHLALNNVPLCSTSRQHKYLSYDHPKHFDTIVTAREDCKNRHK